MRATAAHDACASATKAVGRRGSAGRSARGRMPF
ncbi:MULTISPECIES: DUF6411 family protein [unclassified Streptomyces]